MRQKMITKMLLYCCSVSLLLANLTLSWATGPCDAVRWTQGAEWADGSPNDSPANSAPNKGIIRCGSAADTQSNIQETGLYDSANSFPLGDVSCMDPGNTSVFTPINAPSNGDNIIWIQFDVRAYAGTYEFQIINGSVPIAWELYYSNAPAADGSGGDCTDLTFQECGTDFASWANFAFEVPVFSLPTNYYVAVYSRDPNKTLNSVNFKARNGCGDGDFAQCFVESYQETTTCNEDGSYTLTIPIGGTNGSFQALQAVDADSNVESNVATLTNLGSDPPEVTANLIMVYPSGVNYSLAVLDVSGNADCGITNINGTAPVCAPQCALNITCPSDNGANLTCVTDLPEANTNLITINDNCGVANITVNDTDNGESACPNSPLVVTRVYTVADDETTATCMQTFTIVNDNVPVLGGVPNNITVACDAVPDAANPTATATCGEAIIILNETLTNGDCPNSYSIKRMWTATDDCGNGVSATQIITVVDDQAPILSGVPDNATVACDAVPDAANPTATDNCSEVAINTSEVISEELCGGSYVITRTWTAIDNCGNASEAVQVITVVDDVAPSLEGVPQNSTISCNETVPDAATPTATDNCGGIVDVSLQEIINNGDCGAMEIVRTFTATDDCGNMSMASYSVMVIGAGDLSLNGVPDDLMLACGDAVPETAVVTANNGCGEVTVTVIEEFSEPDCYGNQVLVRTFTASDNCGGEVSATQIITVTCDAPIGTGGGATTNLTYCDSYNTSGSDHKFIEQVNLNTIDNTSGFTTYSDYTSISTEVGLGYTYPINLSPGFTLGAYEVFWTVYIDFNQDGDFEDADELVLTDQSIDAIAGAIAIPDGAALGVTTMRIVMNYDGLVGPCDLYYYGETEDYTIVILPADCVEEPPIIITPPVECNAMSNDSSFEWIEWVSFADLMNGSDAANYSDFTGLTANVAVGGTYVIELIPGYLDIPYVEYWTVWIDFNGDGDFEDADELVFQDGPIEGATMGYITIPAGLDPITTVMRITMNFSGFNGPCEVFSYGEVEDYSVTIGEPAEPVLGCTEVAACNYNPNANTNDDSCDYSCYGCDDAEACNYDPMATVDDGSCNYSCYGCTDETATNYNPEATIDDGSCATCSDGIQNGDEEGTDCGGSACIPCPCVSMGLCAGYEWIESVTINTINNVSGSDDGYGDYSSLSTVLETGEMYDITLTPGFAYSEYAEYFQVYIDFSQDQVYTPNELVFDAGVATYETIEGSVYVPVGLPEGSYTMRIVMNYGSYPEAPCGYYHYGETEDYTIEVVTGDGVPNENTTYCDSEGGNTYYEWIENVRFADIDNTSGNDNGYGDYTNLTTEAGLGYTYAVDLTAAYLNAAYAESWRVWIDLNQDGDFNDADELLLQSSGDYYTTTANMTIPASAMLGETRMRVSMKYGENNFGPCSNFTYGEVEDYTIVLVDAGTPPPAEYCASYGECSSYEWIAGVAVNDFMNSSGNDNGYGDYTQTPIELGQGSTAAIQLDPGFSNGTYHENWTVWIDYNQDGVFDANEMVFDNDGVGSDALVSGNFVVANDALLGSTRMRIVMSYCQVADVCGAYYYGETEDYMVNIVADGAKLTYNISNLGAYNTSNNSYKGNSVNREGMLVELYPNPATVQSQLAITIPNKGVVNITIVGLNGVQYYQSMQEVDTNTILSLPVQNLANGVYYVKVQNLDKSVTKKLLITK